MTVAAYARPSSRKYGSHLALCSKDKFHVVCRFPKERGSTLFLTLWALYSRANFYARKRPDRSQAEVHCVFAASISLPKGMKNNCLPSWVAVRMSSAENMNAGSPGIWARARAFFFQSLDQSSHSLPPFVVFTSREEAPKPLGPVLPWQRLRKRAAIARAFALHQLSTHGDSPLCVLPTL